MNSGRGTPRPKQSPPAATGPLFTPGPPPAGKPLRYYQEIAVNRAVAAIAGGRPRTLLTMATGTGKTLVAFHVCWRLWQSRWNLSGEHRRPRILYLADRTFLVDDPKDKEFAPFGEARTRLGGGVATTSREIYFATYQAIARDEARPGLYRQYPRDFFDLVIVDECHRGSANDESNWREILEWFEPTAQLGMTATPRRDDNANTYEYFGAPLYTYSLRQGIEDGFLAPYRVHRIVTSFDAAGWRPSPGEVDRYDRQIPDRLYGTPDFDRRLALLARTETVARHLTRFLRENDPYAKTIVFCVDQEHADEMRRLLNNLNADLVQRHRDWVCRITADEGEVGRRLLDRFKDVETDEPVVVTTSRLLTTGVDIPTCRNVVLVRDIRSMTEFKQIIGRGTRVRDDYDKLFFNIIDYTGSATRLFADPDFDGDPEFEIELRVREDGTPEGEPYQTAPVADDEVAEPGPEPWPGDDGLPRKLYVDRGQGRVVLETTHDLGAGGNGLTLTSLVDRTGETVRRLYRDSEGLRQDWIDPERRREIVERLAERGIAFAELERVTGRPDADPFDLLCHLAFDAPVRSRRERAELLRRQRRDFFQRWGPEARAILDDLLEKYAVHGTDEFRLPESLEVPPINERGSVLEIARLFGGEDRLVEAVKKLQELLYAA